MKKWALFLTILYSSLVDAQVNLQTGAAELGFPLFQYADAKSGLNTAIALTYIAGNGLKVDELASPVGTGWALAVGGAVIRIQNGEPDDQVGRTSAPDFIDALAYGSHPEWDYPNGYLYTTALPQNQLPGHVMFNPQFPFNWGAPAYRQNFDDREQDVFAFQFNGRIGKFIIGKNKVPKILNDSRLVVSFVETDMTAQDIQTRISSFTITDEQGIQYKFDEREITEVLLYNQANLINNQRVLKGVESGRTRRIITKWFLKEIINPLTAEKIVFNYSPYNVDIEGVKHITRQTITASGTNEVSQETLLERTKMVSQRLISIQFPDPYKVDFVYKTTERVDLPGDKALIELNVTYNENFIYGFEFNYGYFFKGQIVPLTNVFQPQDKRFARLCLKDFKKIGSNGAALPAHEFTYNLPSGTGVDIIPPMYSLSTDHWGYYNPNHGFISEDADGYPSSSLQAKTFFNYALLEAKYGIIKTVKYPEGGTHEWYYEGNQAEGSPFTANYAGGVRVNKTVLYDGIDHNNDIIKEYNYIKEDGTSSAWAFETPVYTETRSLRQYPLSQPHNQGINVKDIATNFISRVFYNAPKAYATQSVSGGTFITSNLKAAAFDVMVAYVIAQIIHSIVGDPYKDYTLSLIKNDNYNLMNPLPFQYARVEVVDAIYTGEVRTGTNGKTEYVFTSDQDFPLLDPGPLAIPFSTGKQRATEWLYGLPKSTTWFNAAGQRVKKVENFYNSVSRQITTNNHYISKSWYINKLVSGNWEMNSVAFDPAFVNTVTYYPFQGRAEMHKTTETIFNSNNVSASFDINYTYSDSNFLPRTVYKKDSKGDYIGTTTYYTADYNNTLPIMEALKNANKMNEPVSVNSWTKSASDVTRQLTGSTVMEFAQLSNYDLKPFQIYQSELSVPVANSIAEPNDINFSKSNYKNYSYLKPKSTTIYSDGNPIQSVENIGNTQITHIYDYNKRLIVAEIANAMNQEVKYTSFEGTNMGGWNYIAQGIITDISPTGKKCYDLTKGGLSIESPAAINEAVAITLWATQSQVTITHLGTTYQPASIGPNINGWTLLEFELPAVTGNISVTGNSRVDEVRLYPKNARMTTYTHEPGIGKTTECDANNRILYYEYDPFGRLKTVKDQYRNLIKAYEYNYKQ